MRVRGSVSPSTAFSIEQQPNKPGYILVRFYENVQPYREERDDGILTGFEYDEYTLELMATATIEDDIFNQYSMYLEQAKLQELNRQEYDPVQNKQQQEQAEQARADIDFIAAMTGVDLV
ncbi:MAG: hypothetical protein NC489_18835 [Ruminococcus flavefaciens]|nr:hypothetical protein [Ruminococcus flavefaciens]